MTLLTRLSMIGLVLTGFTAPIPALATEPRLLVVIVIDQLRRDRLSSELPGGLGKLTREGRAYVNATLDHAVTNTCPGHAVVSTGVQPADSGIPGNTYIDRGSWTEKNCVDSLDVTSVVLNEPGKFRGPQQLRTSTLGDWIKASVPDARVYSVGGKDRSAIILGGSNANGAYWYNRGTFTTSQYYEASLPDWLRVFNGNNPPRNGFQSDVPSTWDHPASSLREDHFPGEDTEFSNSSGHPLISENAEETAKQIYHSPYLDQATLAIAGQLVKTHDLGQDEQIDLLTVGLSATDTVGHLYGPFSAESEATLRMLDESLGEFLALLDQEVGTGHYTIALTADHGVAALPEWQARQGDFNCPVESGRASIYSMAADIYFDLYLSYTFAFGNPLNLVSFAGGHVTVNRQYSAELGHDPNDIIEWLQGRLEEHPGIARAWTANDITSNDPLGRLYQNSWVPDRSGDILIQLARDCLFQSAGTNHGTPYEYDREIPLIFYGAGINPGQVLTRAHSVDIAPTLAAVAGIDSPPGLAGQNLLPLSSASFELSKMDTGHDDLPGFNGRLPGLGQAIYCLTQ